jgi:hypothetical protein
MKAPLKIGMFLPNYAATHPQEHLGLSFRELLQPVGSPILAVNIINIGTFLF